MIFGFNTDVSGKDATYHVQTEDRGEKNPVIDSIIYVGGKIVDRVQTPYLAHQTPQAEVEAMVRTQHRELVESLRSGTFAPSAPQAASAPSPPSGYAIRLLSEGNMERDDHLCFEFSVWDRAAMKPLQGISLDVRWIPAGCPVQEIALQTGDYGTAGVSFPVPDGNPTITLLVCAKGPEGREFAKFLVRPVSAPAK